MPREKQDYRETLRLIQESYPDRLTVTIDEACKLAGVRDRRRLLRDKAFPSRKVGGKYAISITALARYLS